MLVSFDLFFQRFEGGEAADSDQELLGRLLQPYLADTGYGFSDLRFSDGNAAIYGVDDLGSGLDSWSTTFPGRRRGLFWRR